MPLIFVPTPLGNLRDITLRALDVLRECDLVVAEDTRVARRLLSAHGIAGKTLWSYREQNAAGATAPILERARTARVAVVSDAGTPGISDPGRELIAAARAGGVPVEVLPGAVAFVTAAVLSGFSTTGLVFEGFVPRSGGARRRAFEASLARGTTAAWYESPARLLDTLRALTEIAPAARVFVARELTKLHEQQILGTPADVLAQLEQPVRGEIVLLLEGSDETGPARQRTRESGDGGSLESRVDELLAEGATVAQVAKRLARERALPRAEVYALTAKRRKALARRD